MNFHLYFVLLFCGYSYALTDEEMLIQFGKILLGCNKENPVDMSDLLKLQQLVIPTKPEVKCLLACGYRGLGTLKSDGTFGLEEGYKVAEQAASGDEKRLENAKKLVDICIKVNDKPVSDGEKGCERAALMYACGVEHAPKLGFNIRLDPSKLPF